MRKSQATLYPLVAVEDWCKTYDLVAAIGERREILEKSPEPQRLMYRFSFAGGWSELYDAASYLHCSMGYWVKLEVNAGGHDFVAVMPKDCVEDWPHWSWYAEREGIISRLEGMKFEPTELQDLGGNVCLGCEKEGVLIKTVADVTRKTVFKGVEVEHRDFYFECMSCHQRFWGPGLPDPLKIAYAKYAELYPE